MILAFPIMKLVKSLKQNKSDDRKKIQRLHHYEKPFFYHCCFLYHKTMLNYDITQGIMWKIKGIPSVS